ncbi:MAG TPA: hypothetical protein VHY91_06025 [Pirellulales bacterium]|nr:hypothetical protein [Pirellulales bacterium]
MTTIPKSVLKSFRATAKRIFGRGRNDSIWLSVTATPEELFLRSVSSDTAIEYRVQDQFEPATFAVPLEQLAACDAKSPEPVSFEPSADGVTVQWLDRGIPQQIFCPAPSQELPAFPAKPTQVWTTDAGLLRALADAADTTDAESSRYALGCVCLRGQSGSIAATDGRQLFVQRGCEFPWSEDLLIPASPVFRSRELAADGPVTIGATDQHVAIGSDRWTIWLPINKDGRFPKIDDNIRPDSTAKSRLNLASADVEFLLPRLDSLPADHDCNSPITLDLNGHVTIRAWAEGQPRPLELVLSNSTAGGEPASVCMNRQFLARAIRLGFEQLLVFGPQTPVQCSDDRRTYIWMVLDDRQPSGLAADPVRIESPVVSTGAETPAVKRTRRRAGQQQAAAADRPRKLRVQSPAAVTETSDNPIEAAQALRTSLRETLASAHQLVRSLKRRQRQERLVANTLASLKQLQRLAG